MFNFDKHLRRAKEGNEESLLLILASFYFAMSKLCWRYYGCDDSDKREDMMCYLILCFLEDLKTFEIRDTDHRN